MIPGGTTPRLWGVRGGCRGVKGGCMGGVRRGVLEGCMTPGLEMISGDTTPRLWGVRGVYGRVLPLGSNGLILNL